jgi:DNA-binding transcriptional ArsR family regulator
MPSRQPGRSDLSQTDSRVGAPTESEARVEPLQVIAAPRRLRILELVWDRELSAGQIAAQFEVSWSAISQHLTVLKAAGFVSERREGTSRMYRTDQAALGSLRSIVEEHWRSSLNRMKDLAEAEQRDKDRS